MDFLETTFWALWSIAGIIFCLGLLGGAGFGAYRIVKDWLEDRNEDDEDDSAGV